MKLIKHSTIVFILSNLLCLSASAEDGIESPSFQKVKQELWAFGPESEILKSSGQRGESRPTQKASRLQNETPEQIPEELSRALVKYSVEL